MIFNKNDFLILKKFLKNIKFGLQIFQYGEHFERSNRCFEFKNERYDVKYKNILYFVTNRSIIIYIVMLACF
jgi:hypothetical protein